MIFAAVGGAVLRSGYALPAHRPAHGTITIGRGSTYPKRNSVSTKPTTSFTQALITLNLAREAGIERIVYFSVIHSDLYVNVPHFAAKHAVERMIEKMGLHATILRPAYFINNDSSIKDAVTGNNVYPMPIGDTGLAMVDVRDVGEIAALELTRREQASEPLPLEWIDLVGPDMLTGSDIAAIWSDVLGREIAYGGNDSAAFEQSVREHGPSWLAYDMRMMVERFQSDGMRPESGDVDRLTSMLGRPLRSYRDFVLEITADERKNPAA